MILPAVSQMTVVARFGDVSIEAADIARAKVDCDHCRLAMSVNMAALSAYRLRVWFADRLIVVAHIPLPAKF